MDDVAQVARFRDEVPAQIDLTAAEQRIMARISGADPLPRTHRGYGRRFALAGGVAAALAVGAVTVQSLPDGEGHRPAHTGTPTLRPSNSLAEVAVNARLVADTTPTGPRSDQWTYSKTLSAEAGRHRTSEVWVRADGKQTAWIRNGKIVLSGVMPTGATPGTWPRGDSAYLNSLPTDPGRLRAVIEKNNAAENYVIGSGDAGVFADIQALMENVPLSPRLAAAFYGVLAKLPEVRLDRSVTDAAGRRGIGLYMTLEGYIKAEIVIDPKTYAYLGQQQLAVKDHILTGVDGKLRIHKGRRLSWDAVLAWGIVDRPGQRQ
jgi:hypothetical protein